MKKFLPSIGFVTCLGLYAASAVVGSLVGGFVMTGVTVTYFLVWGDF